MQVIVETVAIAEDGNPDKENDLSAAIFWRHFNIPCNK